MSSSTIETNSPLSEYLPEKVENEEQVKEAFREASLEYHPDQNKEDTGDVYSQILEEREQIESALKENGSVEITEDQGIVDYLEQGVEGSEGNYEVSNSFYDGDGSLDALVVDQDSSLKVRLETEISKDLNEGMETEAQYFTDAGGEIESKRLTTSSFREMTDCDEIGQEEYSEAAYKGMKITGEGVVDVAENIKQALDH